MLECTAIKAKIGLTTQNSSPKRRLLHSSRGLLIIATTKTFLLQYNASGVYLNLCGLKILKMYTFLVDAAGSTSSNSLITEDLNHVAWDMRKRWMTLYCFWNRSINSYIILWWGKCRRSRSGLYYMFYDLLWWFGWHTCEVNLAWSPTVYLTSTGIDSAKQLYLIYRLPTKWIT